MKLPPPKPPEGYRLLTGEEKTKPLPMDTLVLWGEHWEPSTLRGHKITLSSDFGNLYATAQPLPCFQSPDQGQWTEGKHAFPPERVAPEPTAEQASEPCSAGDAAETIERNPKSWAAWKREAERLEQRIAELERDNTVLWEQLADRDKLVADYRTQLAASEKDRELILPIVRDFVQKNPKHDFRGVEQDPWGSHALLARLERFDALKEGK